MLACERELPRCHRGTSVCFYEKGSTLFIADISAGSENTVLVREIYVRPETGQRKVVSVIFIPAE